MRKSKKNEDSSVKVGNGAQFSGDAAIGKGAKVVKNSFNINKVKKSFQDDPIKYIIAGIIIIVGGALIVNWLIPNNEEKIPNLRLNVESVSGFDISCVNNVDPEIIIEIANLGSGVSDFNQYYYVLKEQVSNTCGNFKFFNDTKPICLFEYVDDGESQLCRKSTRPINPGYTVGIKYNFNEEAYRLIERLENTNMSSCQIDEFIYICTGFNENQRCANTEVDISYRKCSRY